MLSILAKLVPMNAASRLRVHGRSPSLQLVEPTLCSPVCYKPPAAPSMLSPSPLTSVKLVFSGIAPSSEKWPQAATSRNRVVSTARTAVLRVQARTTHHL